MRTQLLSAENECFTRAYNLIDPVTLEIHEVLYLAACGALHEKRSAIVSRDWMKKWWLMQHNYLEMSSLIRGCCSRIKFIGLGTQNSVRTSSLPINQ